MCEEERSSAILLRITTAIQNRNKIKMGILKTKFLNMELGSPTTTASGILGLSLMSLAFKRSFNTTSFSSTDFILIFFRTLPQWEQ